MSFIDDFGSGSSTPSASWLPGVFGEILVMLLIYRFLFFVLLRNGLESQFSKASWWDYLRTFRGLFCQDVQKEIVYLTILGLHHLLGGGLMLAGWIYNSDALWLQGFLVEVVDDLHDTGLMFIPAWPFAGAPGEKRDMKIVSLMTIHHVCGLALLVPVILAGLFRNPYVQTCGWALLLAGGVSCIVLSVNRTINRNTPIGAWKTFVVWMTNLSFYYYCRFWVFSKALYGLFSTEWGIIDTTTRAALVFAAVFMSLFNLAIGVDATIQAVGLFQNAINISAKERALAEPFFKVLIW